MGRDSNAEGLETQHEILACARACIYADATAPLNDCVEGLPVEMSPIAAFEAIAWPQGAGTP
jgi:hypothetical protein